MSVTPCRAKWTGTMTDRERFNNQMHYKPVDRCFNMEFGYWQENYEIWDAFVRDGIKTESDANLYFNFDKIACIGGRNWMHPGFEQKVISQTEDKQIIQNNDGLLAEVAKDGHSSIPHFTKASIVTPEDWKQAKEERFAIDNPSRVLDVDAILKRHPNDRDYPLGVNCGSMIGKIRDMLTFEGLAYAMYDYPDMVEDMVETCCQLVEHSLDQLLPTIDFDYASGWEDICFKNGPIVGVDFFNNVVVPRYQRINAKLKAHGIDIWYTDCDGDVRPIMDGLLAGGINCLFPFEVMGCAHPSELLDKYGEQLRIMGGFDKIQMVAGKPQIKTYMESLVPLVERGGYIPFCDHRCPPDVTYENYLYYLDLKEEMFGM
jgi:hypothetical protein